MKIRTNLMIDAEKKAIFEALQPIHGKTMSDILDDALDSVIGDVAPDALLELQIQDYEIKLATLKQGLVEAKYFMSQRNGRAKKEQAKSQIKEDLDSRLASIRNDLYEEHKKSLAFMVKRKTIDWKHNTNLFQFSNTSETQEYIKTKLISDGLL